MATRSEDMNPRVRARKVGKHVMTEPAPSKHHPLFIDPKEQAPPYSSKKMSDEERKAALETIKDRLNILKAFTPDIEWKIAGSKAGTLLLWAQIKGPSAEKNKLKAQQLVEPLSHILPDIRYGNVAGTDNIIFLPNFDKIDEKELQEALEHSKKYDWLYEAHARVFSLVLPVTDAHLDRIKQEAPKKAIEAAIEAKALHEKLSQSTERSLKVAPLSEFPHFYAPGSGDGVKIQTKLLWRKQYTLLVDFFARIGTRFVRYGDLKKFPQKLCYQGLRDLLAEHLLGVHEEEIDNVLIVNMSVDHGQKLAASAREVAKAALILGESCHVYLEPLFQDNYQACLENAAWDMEKIKTWLQNKQYDFMRIHGKTLKVNMRRFEKNSEAIDDVMQMLMVGALVASEETLSASVDAKSAEVSREVSIEEENGETAAGIEKIGKKKSHLQFKGTGI